MVARGRGQTFNAESVTRLLDLSEEILPAGPNEWNQLAAAFNFNRPPLIVGRDEDSLRNKFKALKNVRKPTGDPTCPPDVKRAKRIQKLIEAKVGVAGLDDGVEEEVAEEEGGDGEEGEGDEEGDEDTSDSEDEEAQERQRLRREQRARYGSIGTVASAATAAGAVAQNSGDGVTNWLTQSLPSPAAAATAHSAAGTTPPINPAARRSAAGSSPAAAASTSAVTGGGTFRTTMRTGFLSKLYFELSCSKLFLF